jgi:diguanylate cyclase (GGDEF)-like protein
MKKYIYLIVNLILLIPAIVIVYLYAYTYVDKEVKTLVVKEHTLNKIHDIYDIITNLQKIRGLNNIDMKNIEISNKIKNLNLKNDALADKLQNEEINKLLHRYKDNNTKANFESYTSDIDSLLFTYKLTAYNAKLTLNSDIKEYLLSKTVVSGLPYMAEYFARIRGLAASVHEQKLENEVKLKIQNQLYMIDELLKNTKELQYFNNSEFVDKLIISQKKEMQYVKDALLNKETITLSGLEIFTNITKNIDYLNTAYNTNMNYLYHYYQEIIDEKNMLKTLIIIVCILSILIVVFLNIFYFSKIQDYIQKVKYLTVVDPMTTLYNRRFLENFIDKFVSQSQRQKTNFSILMFDIDFFKKVNDTYGHDVGDKVIVKLAEILRAQTRKSDLAIRYGGEEFLVLLHNATDDGAIMVAQKIKDAFSSVVFNVGKNEQMKKTISIGIAKYPKDADSIWQTIKYADIALYVAKTTGRDKIVTYTQEMSTSEEA